MNYRQDINEKLKDHIQLAVQLLLLVLGAYIFIMAEDDRKFKIPVLFFGLLAWVLFRDKTKHPVLWIVFFILLLFDLFHSYFWLANHHFMLSLMVLAVINFKYHSNISILKKNIQLLLVVVLLTSILQKLFSSQFMSGDFYYYMANRGVLFRSFLLFFPDNLDIVRQNSEQVANLHYTNPNLGEIIILKDIVPNLSQLSVYYVWATIAMEFFVVIAIWFKPQNILTHLLLAVMILGILLTRLETGFMALLAISGMFLCSRWLKLKLLYLMIVIGCLTLIMTKRGFY